MLQVFHHSFPTYSVRMASVSYSMFPSLLKQLNQMDVIVLDCFPNFSGSYIDHEQYIHPFLEQVNDIGALWLIRTPNLTSVTDLYDAPYYVNLEFTEVAYISSNIDLLHAYRFHHMFNNHFSILKFPLSLFLIEAKIVGLLR